MFKFIQTFKQYFIERRDDEDEERGRHLKVKHREKEQHDRILATGGKEGEGAENARHRAARRSEQSRHVRDKRSRYKYSAKSHRG